MFHRYYCELILSIYGPLCSLVLAVIHSCWWPPIWSSLISKGWGSAGSWLAMQWAAASTRRTDSKKITSRYNAWFVGMHYETGVHCIKATLCWNDFTWIKGFLGISRNIIRVSLYCLFVRSKGLND